jgi:hypothetical protein
MIESAQKELERRKKERAEGRDTAIVTEAPSILDWVDSGEVMIEDRHHMDAVNGSWVRCVLWPAQRAYLKTRETFYRTVCMKARQLGFSWTDLIETVWLALFFSGTATVIVSKDEDSAIEMIRRARGIITHLKNPPARQVGRDNQMEIKLSNGSIIKAFANTANAGTSFTATKVVIEEADKLRFGASLYQSLKPLIADGNMRMSVLFTVWKSDGLGRKLWELASDEPDYDGIKRVFVPWWARPGRDQAWYDKELSQAVSPAFHKQDYPATAEEALNFSDVDARFVRLIGDWDELQSAVEPRSQVIALDAGIESDYFAMVGCGWHPSLKVPLIGTVKTWRPVDETGKKKKTVDLTEVESYVTNYLRRNKVKKLVYDPYQLAAFGQRMEKEFNVEKFSQMGKRDAADTMLYKAILTGGLLHGESMDLREAVDNADIDRKDDNRLRIIKRRESLKIDAAVAASMAHYELITNHPFNKGTDGAGGRQASPEDIAQAFGQKPVRPTLGVGRPKMIGTKYGTR